MNDSNASTFDKATRIAAGDGGTSHDGVAIALHWATAFILALLHGLAALYHHYVLKDRELVRMLPSGAR